LNLLLGAGIIVAAVVAARLAHQAGLPALLLFLGLGLVLGESGAGIRFDNVQLTEVLGLSALVLILAEGGLTTNWAHARPAMPAALLLATVGVGVSILIVGVSTRYLLGFSWQDALLLGAVLAPTDAAAVFSVLRKLPLPPRLSGMLEGESGLNDPAAVLAVTLPSRFTAAEWGPAWVGFDVALLAAFAGTGWALWKRRQIVIGFLIVTATLLCCDAWFDCVLDWGTSAFWLSLASALLAELPVAGVLVLRARWLMRMTMRIVMAHTGHVGPVPTLWRIPLFDTEPGEPVVSGARRTGP